MQRFLTRVRYRVRTYNWRAFGTLALLLLSSALLLIVVLAWQLPYGSGLFVEPGEVAGFNVVAPQRITFESEVLTERLRERAAQAVADQYDTQETRLRRQQFNRAKSWGSLTPCATRTPPSPQSPICCWQSKISTCQQKVCSRFCHWMIRSGRPWQLKPRWQLTAPCAMRSGRARCR
ncbi:MAG: hypothetical protein IPK16_05570 [Anaerolineales bacterium]|nr:hypothetical protein [Anaerolineales bacterium]